MTALLRYNRDVASADHTTTIDRRARGAASQQAGQAFEVRVGELYRLLGYDVTLGRLFAGRQVDLFLTGRFGDLVVQRAIECKVGPVGADEIDAFSTRLRLVRSEVPGAHGTIVSAVSFTDAVAAHAAREGIQLTMYRDLLRELLDGPTYVAHLLRELETDPRYVRDRFIEQLVRVDRDEEPRPAFVLIDEWLADPHWNQLTLLGDVGTGKSFLSRVLAYRLAQKYLADPVNNPFPILIDLRHRDRELTLEGLIATHFAERGISRVAFAAFQHAVASGQAVVLFDGFDEMAARVSTQVTARNFVELTRCVNGMAKVLLTCRTHYFRSRSEEEEIVLGNVTKYDSDSARELYWELIARTGFQIAYVQPFSLPQIEAYVRITRPATAALDIAKIQRTYNLVELSQRPMLLDIIVRSLDRIRDDQVNAATLYQVFTDTWIHRDNWRDVLSPAAKLTFLTALSFRLWADGETSLNYTALADYARSLGGELGEKLSSPHQFAAAESEVRTATFLTRDDAGNYGFAHKSYAEFFLARYIASELAEDNARCLTVRRLSAEVITFLYYMVDVEAARLLLTRIVRNKYKVNQTENAVISLYHFARASHQGDLAVTKIVLPERMKLAGAKLEQVSLEGATLLNADLSNASLTDSDLGRTDLSGSSLIGATANNSNFTSSILRNCDLTTASFTGCNFEGADLSASTVRHANFRNAFLGSVRAKRTKGLRAAHMDGAVSYEHLLGGRKEASAARSEAIVWDALLEMHGMLTLVARRAVRTYGYSIDPDDCVSNVILSLSRPGTAEKVVEMDAPRRMQYARSALMHAISGVARSQGREVSLDELLVSNDVIAPPADHDWSALLSDAPSLLTPETWQIVRDYYIDGIDLGTISRRMGRSVRAVTKLREKGLEILRRYAENSPWA